MSFILEYAFSQVLLAGERAKMVASLFDSFALTS